MGALQTTTGSVVYGTQSSTDTNLRGFTWTMPELQNLNIVQGRSFTQAEEEHAAHVAIIGTDIEENLLNGDDPLGKEIRVDGVPYTVIGMGEKQGKTLGQSQDNWVAVPISAFQKTYGTQKSIAIYAKAAGGGAPLDQATDEVDSLMRTRRHDSGWSGRRLLAGYQRHVRRRCGPASAGPLRMWSWPSPASRWSSAAS